MTTIICLSTSKICVFGNPSLISNKKTITGNKQNGIIDSLKNALFSSSPDFKKADDILKRIRDSKRVSLIEPLQEIHSMVQEKTYFNFERKLNPYFQAQYETEATIISLKLDRDKVNTLSARTQYLFQQTENKLINKKVANAELILLKENATAITTDLLNVLDKSTNPGLQIIALSVMKNSKDSIIENEILKRVKVVEKKSSLYSNMLSLLSEKGGIETFRYLQEKNSVSSEEVKSMIKVYLKKLSENTGDSILKTQINEFIKN